MDPVYLKKTLAAASSSGIGTISTAATPVTTINAGTLDTGRRVILWSTGTNIQQSFTVTGTRETGQTFSEIVTGSSVGTPVATINDFLTVASVVTSAAPASTVYIGTNTQGGTPWQSVDIFVPVTTISAGITFSSTANSMAASIEFTLEDFNNFPNPNTTTLATWISSMFSTITGNGFGVVNIDGQVPIPISYWRMTLTSSSSTAGTVYCTGLQSGT